MYGVVAALCADTLCNWKDQWKGEFETSQSNLGGWQDIVRSWRVDGSRWEWFVGVLLVILQGCLCLIPALPIHTYSTVYTPRECFGVWPWKPHTSRRRQNLHPLYLTTAIWCCREINDKQLKKHIHQFDNTYTTDWLYFLFLQCVSVFGCVVCVCSFMSS